MSEDTVQEVRCRLLDLLKKSLRRLLQETGMSKSTCHRATQKAKIHAYHITAVHELKEPDREKHVAYCRWLQAFLNEHPGILDFVWLTDEAWFHLSGYVNSQNTRVWAAENPHVYHEEPLHPLKVGVWCAISRRRIIGPIFFEEIVNTEVYVNFFETFVNQLDDELQRGFSQQDGATCHMSNDSTAEIESFFEDRIISKGLWPPRSPDLTLADFFLWGILKGCVWK
jgi:hypothetical protein